MSSGTAAVDSDVHDDIEMRLLADDALNQGKHDGGKATKKPDDLLQRIFLSIDERVSVKTLMSLWTPRFEFIVRLMLVATFLDDSTRTALQFSSHIDQVGEQGCLRWLVTSSPEVVRIIAAIVLGTGILAQLLGSLYLLALRHPDYATKALIGWTIAQPVLYSQLSNIEFVAESISLVGGLLMLRAHLVAEPCTQLIGRLLLPTMYLYYAGVSLVSALTYDTTTNYASFLLSLSIFVGYTLMLVGLVIGATLVAAGLKSRVVALLLALANIGVVCYRHPFFRFIYLEGGKWKYHADKMTEYVATPTDVSPTDLYNGELYDLHKYYFFLGLSNSAALLLLAQFGPGEIAVQKNEVLVPVVERAKD